MKRDRREIEGFLCREKAKAESCPIWFSSSGPRLAAYICSSRDWLYLLYSTCILTLSTTAILQFLPLKKRLRPGHLYPRSLHKRQCAGLLHLGRDPFVREVHRHDASDKRSQSLHRLERGTFHPLETRGQ
jgi:hypothetical protein